MPLEIPRAIKLISLMFQPWRGIMGARTNQGFDLRSVVTESHLEQHLSDPDAYIWELAFWKNDKLRGPPVWLATHGWIFEKYTRPQQLLLLVGHLDAEVMNGGFSQLFYNKGADEVSRMAEALTEMGCQPAAELVRREDTRFRQIAGDRVDGRESSMVGWDEFMTRHFPLGSESGEYGDHRDNTIRCILAYMRTHAHEIFDVRRGE